MSSLSHRLALHRPELRAWAMYDWANSAFVTTVVAAVFPIYFSSVYVASGPPGVTGAAAAALRTQATERFTLTTTIALAVIAVLAPILGAVADHAPIKKKLLALFMAIGVGATAAMFFIRPGGWLFAAILFAVANIGAMGSFVFYDALLPHVARPDEIDRVSTAGYALGYVGGGLLLALNLAWILKPHAFGFSGVGAATRASFVSVAVWWLIFSIPMFRRVREPPVLLRGAREGVGVWRASFGRLRHTFSELRRYRQALLLLCAFLVYNDGIGTIIRLATAYGREIGLPRSSLITAILIVQFIGIPFTFLFGQIADRIGAKKSIFASLAVYGGVSVLGYFMTTALEFYLLAILVGLVQGGCQALSRSLFASMIPKARSSEFFGLFAVFEKFAGILGPAVFAAAIAITGSSRDAILSISAFFVTGAVLLAFVDVDAGRRVARAADAADAADAAAT